MLQVTYDTNVFIDYDPEELPTTGFFLSAVVVTENVSDFLKIQRYCDVRIIRPEDYFPS